MKILDVENFEILGSRKSYQAFHELAVLGCFLLRAVAILLVIPIAPIAYFVMLFTRQR